MTTTAAPINALDIELICKQLKRDEGFSSTVYRDSVGVLTIGYGFNLESDGLSEQEASLVLHLRVWNRYVELLTALPWVKQLDEARQGVLLNMAYNMGVHGLLEFKQTLLLAQGGAYMLAGDAMLRSKWAFQVGARAHRLATQMRTGVWQ